MDNELKLFGKRIAELRTKRGLTQEKLAEIINYSANHISKLELAKTNPSFELLVELSLALDVEIKDLFDFEDYKTTNDIKIKLTNLLQKSDDKKVQLLYKIYRSIDFS